MNHLHTRSCYSLLQSPFQLENIIKKSKEYGFTSVCLTDKQTLFGVPTFLQLCKNYKIKGIVGLEMEVKDTVYGYSHFVLLAKNDTGLQELYALSLKESQGFVSVQEIVKNENCICILEFVDERDQILINNRERQLRYLKKICSNLYVGMCMMDTYPQENAAIKETCKKLHIPTVALSRVLYENQEDIESLRILKAMDQKTTVDSISVPANRYFRTKAEMMALYDAEDLEQTDRIANQCNVDFQLKNDLPEMQGNLKDICLSFLYTKFNYEVREVYIKRLNKELDLIHQKHFDNYFLIVHDFMKYMKEQKVYMGPGRGSATGSLVSYCLEITKIDPVVNDLKFERFLNEHRSNMPDIDIDIPTDKMDLAIQYVKEKYGKENTSFIVVFDKLKARSALEDVSKAMGVSEEKIDSLLDVYEDWKGIDLKTAYNNENFQLLLQDEELMKVYKACLPLENIPKNTTRHPAGIVISTRPILEVCPQMVVRKQNGQIDNRLFETQFDKDYLEDLGLIKFDFLSSRVLMKIDRIKEKLKADGIEVDPMHLDPDDSASYDLLCEGFNAGIFQMKKESWSKLLKQVKPRSKKDLSDLLALFRPGPASNINKFVEGKQNPEQVVYAHPLLKHILKETYGVLLYQEHLLQIAQELGKISEEDSDELRKAISKKKEAKVKEYREIFVQGAIQNGCTEEVANQIFDTMEQFGSYGYNKNHAYAYADVAYQTAYLKAHYPVHFYAEFLSDGTNNKDVTRQLISECIRRNIDLLPLTIKHPFYEVEGNSIQLPISIIQDFEFNQLNQILDECKKGEFTDLVNCVVRLQANYVSRESIEKLIRAGALDCFCDTRFFINGYLSLIMNYGEKVILKKGRNYEIDWTLERKPVIAMDYGFDNFGKADIDGLKETVGLWYALKTLRQRFYPFTSHIHSLDTQTHYVFVYTKFVKEKNGQQIVYVEDETQKTQFKLRNPIRNKKSLFRKYCLMTVRNKEILNYKVFDFDYEDEALEDFRDGLTIQEMLSSEVGTEFDYTTAILCSARTYKEKDGMITRVLLQDETCFIDGYVRNCEESLNKGDYCDFKGIVQVDSTGKKIILLKEFGIIE